MSLAKVVQLADWYSEEEILRPSGAGAKIYAELANKKIGGALRLEKNVDVNVGVLVNDPSANETQSPIAIVCEFSQDVDIDVLNSAQRLAWNFCRSPLLITIEPTQVRALSCYETPEENKSSKDDRFLFDKEDTLSSQIIEFPLNKNFSSIEIQAAESLRWIDLFSGQFFRKYSDRFPTNQRVDYMLLDNLKFIRRKLAELDLDVDIIHDLLARIIFIQFLFQRKDSEGNSAIDEAFLTARHLDGTLLTGHMDLEEILTDKTDTYNFFKWLNNKFNGDLFPGKGDSPEEREVGWKKEMEQVQDVHLEKLAEFISGKMKMERGQPCFWKEYSFDVIPLEFISSIYEVFVDKDKTVHYTPSHLVDFILDNSHVLPWDGTTWDLKILDPACGSGIFLVKAFQRLVQRWKNANPMKPLDGEFRNTLTGILKNNIFGVDINPHAVRVASFSLYLAMCDEIDPKHYWEEWEFPIMRERRIIEKDFFSPLPFEENNYDRIIGNAPWGKSSLDKSEPARKWAKDNKWKVPYKDIGPLFLPRAAEMVKENQVVAIMQPANNLLFNESSLKFRNRLFDDYKIEEIANLSVLRFNLFSDAVSPSCVVTLRKTAPDNLPMRYVCPKNTQTIEDKNRIIIDSRDVHHIYRDEAKRDSLIWTTLVWGSKRDLGLMRKLVKDRSLQNSARFKKVDLKSKVGINQTSKGAVHEQPEILGRRILREGNFPPETFLYIDPISLPPNTNPYVRRKDEDGYSAYSLPQLLVKFGWQVETGRFRAVIVKGTSGPGVLCSQAYITVHCDDRSLLEAFCLSFNSALAVYYFMLLSARFSYRQVITARQALSLPIKPSLLNNLNEIRSFEEIDHKIFELFGLKDSERILVDDLIKYTLPDFIGNETSPGRKRCDRESEIELTNYCDIFRRVLKAGFGDGTTVAGTIFQESNATLSPLRMIRLDLDVSQFDGTEKTQISYKKLWSRLENFEKNFNQRTYRRYEFAEGERGITVYIIKPDQKSYWLKSQAYRDADEVYGELTKSIYGNYLNSLPNHQREKKVA